MSERGQGRPDDQISVTVRTEHYLRASRRDLARAFAGGDEAAGDEELARAWADDVRGTYEPAVGELYDESTQIISVEVEPAS